MNSEQAMIDSVVGMLEEGLDPSSLSSVDKHYLVSYAITDVSNHLLGFGHHTVSADSQDEAYDAANELAIDDINESGMFDGDKLFVSVKVSPEPLFILGDSE